MLLGDRSDNANAKEVPSCDGEGGESKDSDIIYFHPHSSVCLALQLLCFFLCIL